uniref:ABC transporter ATP-binding protein n=1 Tax=candidate division WOR-3 bacterium TaxID=2052148 RepID=A0A7V3KP45_UNCW3
MIRLETVTKRFGTTIAVKNLSFDVNEREFVVLFGPAGAGKTTTLRLIAGITEPTYGEIYKDGQSLKNVPPEKRNFSMVFENYALYSHLSVFENLAFPLRARKMKDAEVTKLVTQMADLLDISAVLDRKPGFLSGGQRQRVALGRGLIRDADLYLLDEPISHLDARLRIRMRAQLKNICLVRQSTVIHVTHDYSEAMSMADKVIVMNNGRKMQEGTPEDIFNNPDNDFVAKFIGNPPMSFVKVSYCLDNGKNGFKINNQQHMILEPDDLKPENRAMIAQCKDLKLGIRANQTSLSSVQDDEHKILTSIYLVETQGHRNLVTVKINDDLVQVITPPEQQWRVGSNVWISMLSPRLHIFADGEALYHPNKKNIKN